MRGAQAGAVLDWRADPTSPAGVTPGGRGVGEPPPTGPSERGGGGRALCPVDWTTNLRPGHGHPSLRTPMRWTFTFAPGAAVMTNVPSPTGRCRWFS